MEAREKKMVNYKGKPIRLSFDISAKTSQARKELFKDLDIGKSMLALEN